MLPVQITIRDIPISSALETNIRKRVEKLQRFYKRIISCHVVIEVPQKHKHQGKLYNVRIDLTVPPKMEFVVTRKKDQDVYIAIREAFNAMTKQLKEYAHKRHGQVKFHHNVMHGHIVRIFSKEGYGFIKGADGNEYYFSITNLQLPMNKLHLGDAVEYIPEQLSEGKQAQHVLKRNNHSRHKIYSEAH